MHTFTLKSLQAAKDRSGNRSKYRNALLTLDVVVCDEVTRGAESLRSDAVEVDSVDVGDHLIDELGVVQYRSGRL